MTVLPTSVSVPVMNSPLAGGRSSRPTDRSRSGEILSGLGSPICFSLVTVTRGIRMTYASYKGIADSVK